MTETTESAASVEVKDFIECVRDENQRLIKKLCFAKKCMELFEDYRKCLIGFANQCRCEHNFDHQMTLNRLERRYRQMVDEDMTPTLKPTAVDIRFNRQQVDHSSVDGQPIVTTQCVETNSGIFHQFLRCGTRLYRFTLEASEHKFLKIFFSNFENLKCPAPASSLIVLS